ncbi:MAG TPA: SURF1 family cytochrome oxidase biogenesis protein [Rhodoglobus sp.]|nr:SURF1 family cytochrome oxidase biogenesis protein [Rhodoglobus sp.]
MSTFWQVARRPKWIGALLLALAVAGAFAALGQWQLERSFSGGEPEFDTEQVVALDSVAEPQQPVRQEAYRLVETGAEFVADDYVTLSGRLDAQGEGYWVVGHAVVPGGASLAVALGWTADQDAAASAIDELRDSAPDAVTGRYLPSEAPIESDFEAGERRALAVPELINLWSQPPDGVYGGYLIAADAPAGLQAIDAPAPSNEVSLNLLNLFYAVEWVIFGGFAFYLWYRLVRDVVEEEAEGAET